MTDEIIVILIGFMFMFARKFVVCLVASNVLITTQLLIKQEEIGRLADPFWLLFIADCLDLIGKGVIVITLLLSLSSK